MNDLNKTLINKMSKDFFSLSATKALRKLYRELLAIKKKGEFSDEQRRTWESVLMRFEELSQTKIKCDHGTIDSSWTYGILMEAIRVKRRKWILIKHDVNNRAIGIKDAEEFLKLENEFPDSG